MQGNAWRSTGNARADRRVWAACLAVLALVGVGVLSGCGSSSRSHVVPPSGVLPRDSFVLVLAEIHVVETAAKQRTYRTDNESMRLAEAYNDVWFRTGVTAERFEASHAWWWHHPEAMKGVLNDVIDRLRDMEVASNRRDAAEPTKSRTQP
jgi:hypothetical protein